VYLTKSNKTELTGAEQYVWNCIQQNDISWFPRLNSSTMQQTMDDQEDEEDSEDKRLLSDMSARMARLEATLSDLATKLK
jgi:hypothetical protein